MVNFVILILLITTIFSSSASGHLDDERDERGRAFYSVFSKMRKPSGHGHGRGHEKEHSRYHPYIDFDRVNPDKPGDHLYATLMRNYNYHILPINATNDTVVVGLLLKLVQIADVDEKNQIMTTNVWLRHEWYDRHLRWNPAEFGGIKTLHIPADEIWLPDTVLYNNADGDYQITIHNKVEVNYDGLVVWEPPAIYKSFCAIDVEFFPYDRQNCEMKFGPWTYDVSKVDFVLLEHDGKLSEDEETVADMRGYYESVEWDVMQIKGIRKVFQYPCCQEKYVDVTYVFNLRRKTLFYTINLIIPCVLIALITVLVFYLPCQSGEKVAFSISTLLSLTWFILLLSEIIPPTSLALPLMGKYLLFTMVLVTMSIAVTVLVLYNHFRHPYACSMPYWVRWLFLDILPMMLWFQSTIFSKEDDNVEDDSDFDEYEEEGGNGDDNDSVASYSSWHCYDNLPPPGDNEIWRKMDHFKSAPEISRPGSQTARRYSKNVNSNASATRRSSSKIARRESSSSTAGFGYNYHCSRAFLRMSTPLIDDAISLIGNYMYLPEVSEAVRCIQYISHRYHVGTNDARMKDDWEAVSRVIDRLFLIIFSVACTLGTIAILLRSPSLYDSTPALVLPSNDEQIVII